MSMQMLLYVDFSRHSFMDICIFCYIVSLKFPIEACFHYEIKKAVATYFSQFRVYNPQFWVNISVRLFFFFFFRYVRNMNFKKAVNELHYGRKT